MTEWFGHGREARLLNPSDNDLWQQARAGDRDAFVTLAQRHAPGLHRLAYHMTGHLADSQDLVQETLLAAYQSLERFRGEASVRTWMVRILTRQIAQHRRRGGYRKTLAIKDNPEVEASPKMAQGSSVAASDAKIDLEALLAQLPEEFRAVILLREIEGLSYDQIGAALGLPRGTVESRIFRGRQKLRELADQSQEGLA